MWISAATCRIMWISCFRRNVDEYWRKWALCAENMTYFKEAVAIPIPQKESAEGIVLQEQRWMHRYKA
jgi:hypothetical protein